MGLFVEAEILGKTVDDVLIVPRSAVQRANRIYVVTADNRLSFRDVEVLRTTGDEYTIRGAVRRGESICLSALDNAVEGQQVRPISSKLPDRDG